MDGGHVFAVGDVVEVEEEFVHEERGNRGSDFGDGFHAGVQRLVSGDFVLAFAFPETAAAEA